MEQLYVLRVEATREGVLERIGEGSTASTDLIASVSLLIARPKTEIV